MPLLMSILVLVSSPGATTASADRTPPEQVPSEMTNAEIRTFNQGLASSHPQYIKCRKIEEIGSLVKKARVCRTNEQWKQAWTRGNQNSRETMDAMTSKAGDCRATGTC
ncbi:hypothetical protein [Sphingopyxis solisilvae]|uniref:hypothetical protein n=1 Tax=Sphingopyxis solisilvae TaxID=1886788 RepID=UPI001892AE69|nr:hypothetical protein [Sphingopyxis solisilvae]